MSSNLSNNNEITPMENPDSPFEEVGNWLKLPCDLMLVILMKVGPFDILEYAQFVCKLWHNFCKKPALWRTIHIQTLDEPERMHQYKRMMVNVVDRSAGGLIDLSIEGFGSDGLFSHVASQLSQLKRLRLAKCDGISEKALVEALEKLSSLEELELTLCDFENREAISIIKSCPSLTTFRFNNLGSKSLFLENDEVALCHGPLLLPDRGAHPCPSQGKMQATRVFVLVRDRPLARYSGLGV
ncbi:F-box protein SKIP19-like [Silene latifolia]|uniref:F-box protein SKIP19-like n=1 Tax=Silene latifolia TaxID=37657 RepID=UPI003D77EB57